MAFSWRKSLKIQLLKLKARRHILLKNGDNVGAKKVADRIEWLQRDIEDAK